jgi:glycosyltransferase involved in cell wall biosynthesis
MRILVVDDEPAVREAVDRALRLDGYRTELAEDGREALMVEPGDVAGLAKQLLTLCEDEALRRRIGEAARTRASTRPTWAESAQLFFEVIREARERTDG